MSTTEILLPLGGEPDEEHVIAHALALAAHLDGRVAGVVAQPNPADLMAWSSEGAFATASASLIESAQLGNEEAWQAAKARFDALAATHTTITLERIIGVPDRILARRAALSDVVVFSCETARGKTLGSAFFEALLLDAAIPIFIPRAAPETLTGTIAIAWDGGLEAARAVKAAKPLLAKAGHVVILQAVSALDDAAKTLAEPSRLVDWLQRQGIQSETCALAGSGDAAKLILQACVDRDVGTLVSGAYGHSRAREFIFGGMTRSLLKSTQTPSLLMCH